MFKYLFKYIVVLILGLFLGILISKLNQNTTKLNSQEKDFSYKDREFKLINPILSCADIEVIQPNHVNNIQEKLINLIEEAKAAGKVTDASIHFRDLNNGPRISINEEEMYTPASLFKITILISYLSIADKNPQILDEKITNELNQNSSTSIAQNIKPSQTLEQGKEYSVYELLDRMIRYSDNLAHQNLVEYLEKNYPEKQKEVVKDFGFGETISESNFVTTKSYSAFFRSLYNATYLSNKNSELALHILTESEYNDGLRFPIPLTTKVSHKFGERGNIDNKNKQLHDCGIIYDEKSPYILCVMTKGQDFTKQSNFIKKVSEIVYKDYVGKN